jgi:hypothetical protein
VTGDEENRHRLILGLHAPQELDAVHFAELDVGYDEVNLLIA